MKKVVIPIVIFFIIAIASIYIPVSMRLDYFRYENELTAHLAAQKEGGEIIAEYKGQKIRLLDGNADKLIWAATLTERQRIFKKPDYDETAAVTIFFPDGAQLIFAPLEETGDKALIVHIFEGRTRYYSLKGYKTMEWVQRIISPEGYYVPNEEIK